MSKPSIVKFIADKRREGLSDSEITHLLLDAGWHMDIIHKTMHGDPIKLRPLEPILDIKKQPFRRDVLLALGTLAFIAGSILLVLFI